MSFINRLAVFFLYIALGGFFGVFFLAIWDVIEPHEGSAYLMAFLPFALISWGILEFLDFKRSRKF